MCLNCLIWSRLEDPANLHYNCKLTGADRIEKVDFEAAKKDVERFLEDKSELKLFKKKTFEAAVSGVC